MTLSQLFTISKKQSPEKIWPNPEFFPSDYVEIDTQIVSGLANGSLTLNLAVEILRNFYNLGIRNILCTYKVSDGDLNHNSELVLAWFENLKTLANRDNQLRNLNLNLSAVYVLDDRFNDLLERACQDTIDDKWILIDFPLSGDFLKCKKMVVELRQSGYNPILTHSEKNRFLLDDLAQFFELRSTGCRFHIGMDSLFLEEGNSRHIAAHWLIRNQMVDFIGTNFSDPKQFEKLQQLSDSPLENLLHPLFLKNNLLNEKRNEAVPF